MTFGGAASATLPPGWRAARFAEIDSTNAEARRRALAGDGGRLWLIAARQSAGRGRRGRGWESPAGNLHATALLVAPCLPEIAPQIGFVAGVALARAVGDLGVAGVGLKWPNDLLAKGAKLAGLLVEGFFLPDRRFAAAVGIGVNCRAAPGGFAYPTADLSSLAGRPIEPEAVFARLAERFDAALTQWQAGAGFAAIRAAWLAHAHGVGGPIRISDASGAREGLFDGLDEAGRLLFRDGRGLHAIEAADVFPIPTPAPPDDARRPVHESRT